MFQTLKNAWRLPDLRRKILYTLLIILVFRLGTHIPVPFLAKEALQEMMKDSAGTYLSFLDTLTGGAFSNATLFALSISPYITSSIVIQLLTVAIPALERMAKEGEEGRKQLNKITRYTTGGLALLQSIAYYTMNRRMGAVAYTEGFSGIFAAVIIILAFVAGALLIVWLGDCIDKNGIGNGISIMLFAGIVSRGPSTVISLWNSLRLAIEGVAPQNFVFVPLIVVLFLIVIILIVLMTNAERRIPVQYAKRVVGRKMYGGQSTHIPIKVTMSGVMPIIFASSLLSIPSMIASFLGVDRTSMLGKVLGLFNYNSGLYAALYFLLIIAFNFFYVAIQYNPIEMANNLRKNSGTIPGIRPGKPTADFISRIINKITLIGAIFLGGIAILPILLGMVSGINIALGGTSIIIVVGVALDTARQLESEMMMRHYKGFLE